MRLATVVAALAVVALAAPACSKSEPKPAAAEEAAAPAGGAAVPGTAAAPGAGRPAVPPVPPAPPPKPKLQIQLRSSPPGAEAQVDGKPAGLTPVTVEIDDNGKEHEFLFLMPGFAMERYKTSPVKSGVIHARMRAVPAPPPAADAGP